MFRDFVRLFERVYSSEKEDHESCEFSNEDKEQYLFKDVNNLGAGAYLCTKANGNCIVMDINIISRAKDRFKTILLILKS